LVSHRFTFWSKKSWNDELSWVASHRRVIHKGGRDQMLAVAEESGRNIERCLCLCSVVRVCAQKACASVATKPLTKLPRSSRRLILSRSRGCPPQPPPHSSLRINITGWIATTKTIKVFSGINPMLFDRITASGKIRVSIYRRSHPKEIP
jgi:hypothetical protein